MSAAHTPGPWSLGRTIGGHIDIDALEAPTAWTALARVVVETEAINGYARDLEGEANARLIAAAPALLDALAEIENASEEDSIYDLRAIAHAAISLAALSLAKGESA